MLIFGFVIQPSTKHAVKILTTPTIGFILSHRTGGRTERKGSCGEKEHKKEEHLERGGERVVEAEGVEVVVTGFSSVSQKRN